MYSRKVRHWHARPRYGLPVVMARSLSIALLAVGRATAAPAAP